MSAAAPWSVKGIDPKAREVAKDLARRSGMTLGEWLNSMIMEDEEEGYATLPRRSQAAEYERRNRSRRLDDAYEVEDSQQRISASIDVIAARLEAAERRSTVAIQGVDQAVAGLMRRLDGRRLFNMVLARASLLARHGVRALGTRRLQPQLRVLMIFALAAAAVALDLPPGAYQVKVRYWPRHLTLGIWISVLGLVCSLAFLARGWLFPPKDQSS